MEGEHVKFYLPFETVSVADLSRERHIFHYEILFKVCSPFTNCKNSMGVPIPKLSSPGSMCVV